MSQARENHGGVARSGQWTFEGKADLHDSGALELNVRSTAGVPRRFDLVRRLLVGRDVLAREHQCPHRRCQRARSRPEPAQRRDPAVKELLPAGQRRYDLDREATPTVE
jgi:hypothetical protein